MGGELFENDEEFRRVMYVCDDALKDMLPEPLLEVLYGDRVDAGWYPYLAILDTVARSEY